MSDMKCPFCQQEIKIAGEHTTIMSCFNGDCKGSGLYGEKAFWQELIRTRKTLEIAVSALKWIYETYNLGMGYEAAIMEKCEFALEQITTLEQKDVK